MNKVHRNFPMVGDGKGKGHLGSREFIGEYHPHLLVKQQSFGRGGSSGGSIHENLELALAKSLTRKDERSESQSKGTEKKILIPPSFCDMG